VIADIDENGVRTELLKINRFQYVETPVPCDGARSTAEIASALKAAVSDLGDHSYVRARLTGAIPAFVTIDAHQLAESAGAALADLVVLNETHPAWDLEQIAAEPTVRGQFVQKLLDQLSRAPADGHARIKQAIDLGLRAFDENAEVTGAL
jgi:hypothetical protein